MTDPREAELASPPPDTVEPLSDVDAYDAFFRDHLHEQEDERVAREEDAWM